MSDQRRTNAGRAASGSSPAAGAVARLAPSKGVRELTTDHAPPTTRFACWRSGPIAALALAAWFLAVSAPALEVPPTPARYFTDNAGVVSREQAGEIEARLAAIEQQTGHQILAVTFASLEGDSLEDFTIRAAQRWKGGRKALDDGVIFFAFINDRRIRLEVGYGLEDKITDALSSRLLADTVKPAFRQGEFGGGVLALAGALEAVFRGDPLPQRREKQSNGGEAIAIIALILLVLLLQAAARRGQSGSAWRRDGRSGYGGNRGGPWGGFGGGSFGGGLGGGGSFGGFSSGGGSFGGGGASGSW